MSRAASEKQEPMMSQNGKALAGTVAVDETDGAVLR
jgi:hypothetical protein